MFQSGTFSGSRYSEANRLGWYLGRLFWLSSLISSTFTDLVSKIWRDYVGTSNTYRGDVAAGPYRRPPHHAKTCRVRDFWRDREPQTSEIAAFSTPPEGE